MLQCAGGTFLPRCFEQPIKRLNGYMPKQFTKRIADVCRFEISSCHLVKHRGKESEVISADKGDLDIGALCGGPIEISRGLYAGEPAPQNNDSYLAGLPIRFMHDV
jgi:hypothetical protein